MRMDAGKTVKTLASLVGLLAVLQFLRMGIEQLLFLFIPRTYFTDDMATMSAMLLLTIGFVIFASAKHTPLSIFPQKFGPFYMIETLVLLGLLVSTPIITGDKTPQTIVVMLYSSVVTPVFEELIFRGYVWNRLNRLFPKEAATYIVVSLLFALWHLGYIEGIAFRVSDGLTTIMLWKMAVGLGYGILLGAVRLKAKNCYATILLHGIMNIFG